MIIYRVSKKTPTTLSMLCWTANWLFFKTEPLSRIARFGRCRASKYPFHISSINRTCTAHRAVFTKNVITSAALSFTHMTQWVQLFCKTFNRSVDSSNKVPLWRYRNTIQRTLHTTSQVIVGRCRIWLPCCPRNCLPPPHYQYIGGRWGSGSHRILRIKNRRRRGIINLVERWLKTIEYDGLCFEE